MSDFDNLQFGQMVSPQLASAIKVKLAELDNKPGQGSETTEDGRLREYYDAEKVFGFKEGAESTSWCLLFGSILMLVLLAVQIDFSNSFEREMFISWSGILGFRIVKSIHDLIRTRHLIDYARVMEESAQAVIPLDTLANNAGVSSQRAAKDLRWLFKKWKMEHCSLILDSNPRVILTDLLLNHVYMKDVLCPKCHKLTKIGPASSVVCPNCNLVLAFIRTEGNNDPASEWMGCWTYDWNKQDTEQYLDDVRTGRIQKISYWLYFFGIIFLFMGLSTILCEYILSQNLITVILTGINKRVLFNTLRIIASNICFLLLSGLLRQIIELAIRCDCYFCQIGRSWKSTEEIASMMGWSVSKTARILKLCFFLNLMRNCSYDNGNVQIGDPVRNRQQP